MPVQIRTARGSRDSRIRHLAGVATLTRTRQEVAGATHKPMERFATPQMGDEEYVTHVHATTCARAELRCTECGVGMNERLVTGYGDARSRRQRRFAEGKLCPTAGRVARRWTG